MGRVERGEMKSADCRMQIAELRPVVRATTLKRLKRLLGTATRERGHTFRRWPIIPLRTARQRQKNEKTGRFDDWPLLWLRPGVAA